MDAHAVLLAMNICFSHAAPVIQQGIVPPYKFETGFENCSRIWTDWQEVQRVDAEAKRQADELHRQADIDAVNRIAAEN